MADPSYEDEWVAVARLKRAWGRRGEVAAEAWTSYPARFQELREVMLFGAKGSPLEPRRLVVERVRAHGREFLFKFEGVDSIGAAEQLTGAEVRIPIEQRRKLPEHEYYCSDLLGCEVIDQRDGQRLGYVAGWLEAGANRLLEVRRGDGRELLIPFTGAICVEIDVERKRVGVNLP